MPTQAGRTRYWEVIADNLSKAGWSWGWSSVLDARGRTIFVVDAHRDDAKRFVVHADEKLTAFLELESAVPPRYGRRASSATDMGKSIDWSLLAANNESRNEKVSRNRGRQYRGRCSGRYPVAGARAH